MIGMPHNKAVALVKKAQGLVQIAVSRLVSVNATPHSIPSMCTVACLLVYVHVNVHVHVHVRVHVTVGVLLSGLCAVACRDRPVPCPRPRPRRHVSWKTEPRPPTVSTFVQFMCITPCTFSYTLFAPGSDAAAFKFSKYDKV